MLGKTVISFTLRRPVLTSLLKHQRSLASPKVAEQLPLHSPLSVVSQRRNYSASASSAVSDNPIYNTVPQVFDRIKTVASAKIVQEVNAIFHFKLSDASYVVDLKNGDGSVAKGSPETKPDVVLVIDSDNLLKLFNRELNPTTAFMTGKLTVKGDLSKALTLEKVMKAAREAGK